MPARTGYSMAQIALHWVIAALIAAQLTLYDGVQQGFDDRMNGTAGADSAWATLHIGIGLCVLGLVVLRLGLRLTRGAPPPPQDNPAIISWAGSVTHLALCLVMFAMPMTGAFAWFGNNEIAAELHELGRFMLIALNGLHVLGALVEHFVFGQNTLLRMFRTQANLPRNVASLPRKRLPAKPASAVAVPSEVQANPRMSVDNTG